MTKATTIEGNGLTEAIRNQLDPFYSLPFVPTEKMNRIYCHQFQGWIDLIAHGLREFSFYIGETDPSRGWKVEGEYLVRFDDGDYSKNPDKPKLYQYWDVHPDIRDHEIRQIMRKYGFVSNIYGGSPEMVIGTRIKDLSVALHLLDKEINKLNEYYNSFNNKHGFSPYVQRKKARKKQEDMYRIPNRFVIYDMCDKLKNLSRDAKIYVPMDAHGHFCDYLCSLGFTNIYTDKGYKYFPSAEFLDNSEAITFITEKKYKKMKFNVVIGNPPYGVGGNLAIDFVNKASERIEDDGIIHLILPLSVRKGPSMNRIDASLELKEDETLPDDTFPGTIRAVRQVWVKGSSPRPKIKIYSSHPDIEFLPYEKRFEADVFIGIKGGGPAGRVKIKDFTDYADTGHHLIKCSEEVKQRLISLEPQFRKEAFEVNGPASLGKHDLIRIYKENFDEQEQTQQEGGFFD